MVRTPCCDKSGMRKGTWTPEEDRKLIAYVTRYGCWNWRQLPKFAGLLRCGKSCRLRWMNYLRPNLKRGNYTKEEDELIIKLHESLGNRWSIIATHLPGRSDNEIKNHWHTSLKKTSKNKTSSSKRSSNKSHSKRQRTRKRRKMGIENENPSSSPNEVPVVKEILESSEFSLLQKPCENSSLQVLSLPSSSSSSTEIIEEYSSGSFWTEPFLTDNYFYSNINNNYIPPNYSLFSGIEEFICSYEENFNTMVW
ncbi:hypothetical protein M9H77_20062 [Catharanthus roseus]|uniref:Uncharacterized protein n=1 Tax=Catharanthus roseus TaxID=4058 RepID=A0ACC0AJG1_CATRO|nr:hypothetical protein M9H77_20062 [Catharanthus roseus]